MYSILEEYCHHKPVFKHWTQTNVCVKSNCITYNHDHLWYRQKTILQNDVLLIATNFQWCHKKIRHGRPPTKKKKEKNTALHPDDAQTAEQDCLLSMFCFGLSLLICTIQ